MEGPQDNGDLSAAEQAFAEFLARQAEDPSADFEAFCRDHPLEAERLHELHSDWRRVSKLLDKAVRDDEPSAALEAHLLHSADPGIALDSDPGVPRQADPTALIHRLAGQRGREDRYPRLVEIARGGMGVIWQVWDQDLRRKLAMKIVRGRIGGLPKEKGERIDARVLSRFLEEAQITAQLEHPGIVPVHDLGIDAQGNVYFTMSLVRGREFKEILQLAREGRDDWTLTRALGVILKVCEAVAYAHSKGVLHRDLKPANIMVGRFGETYVMDWGLARVMGRPDSHDLKPAPLDLVSKSTSIRTERQEFKEHSPDSPLITKYGDVIGTPSYMAPEQAQGLVDNIGPQSDVYAIGAILYHLLCGQMPYVPKGARASHHTVLAAHLMGPPKPVLEIDPTAPPELADICAKAMAREPKRRYATALDMARDIENYLGNRPVSARPASLAYVARLAYKRHKAVVSVAGLAAVALLAFGGFHYVQMGRTVVAKEAALAVSTRLADLNSARALIAQADEVFAPLPERVRRLDAWLGRVNGLVERKPAYERMQAEGDTRAAGEARELLAYVADLERLEPFRHKHRNDVIALEPALDSKEWRAASDDIAHLPVYAGLELAPQWGIEPLQKNPATGLWEFWCPLSGDRPRIDNATTGAIATDEKMAIVLVLLPGGKFVMGAPLSELGDQSAANEREHEELLAPFFAAKYEVSQGQWRRLMESNPAFYALSDLHPVESVSALDCDEFARRLGAALPTEAQWEYACRGGRRTAYWMGDEPSTLQTENTLDVSGAPLGLGSPSEWDDGQRVHAPIGFSGANPYGLFDVHGNVAEWCCDFQSRPGDPSTVKPRNFRGGSFAQPPQYCRAAYRSWDNPKGLNHARGLRVVRAIDP